MSGRGGVLSEEQLSESREVFNYFDSKGDNKIAVGQVGDVLRALGQVLRLRLLPSLSLPQGNSTPLQNPTEAEIAKCCGNYAGESRLSFEDFLPIYQTINKEKESHTCDEFIEGLSHFDKEGSGLINVAELRHLLTTLGSPSPSPCPSSLRPLVP